MKTGSKRMKNRYQLMNVVFLEVRRVQLNQFSLKLLRFLSLTLIFISTFESM